MKKFSLWGGIALALAAVVVYVAFGDYQPAYNVPASGAAAPGQAPAAEQDDETLILVALSGGGTRAAATSWKALESLRQIKYRYESNGTTIETTVADEIDIITGISGGSFAASAWCLFRGEMETFRRRFLERNVQSDLVKNLFVPPWPGLRLVSRHYDRINAAAEFHDREVFAGATFADLPPHPKLWVHATNLAMGTRFTFREEDFAYIGSDLSRYPIGFACAASSAFPILLSPLTLENHGVGASLEGDMQYELAVLNARENVQADFYRRLREFYVAEENRWIHLADGGLVDNQGLEAILDQFETNGEINKRLNDSSRRLKRLVIVNVNAGVVADPTMSREQNGPGMATVIESTMVTSMDILSAKRWMDIKARCQQIYQPVLDGNANPALEAFEKPYTIEVSYRNVRDPGEKEACNQLPTSFYLNEDQLGLIDRVVPKLVDEDPDMERLREALSHD